ncbi:hypothetical protein R3P38DRAFT_3189137 [Favolaschia claudopus]|uniref:Uncharacterized protein n=1 Tax=Favolaschia claudopus TaxID=2862362 RepID=A0AAW0BTU8_9AGAR
MLRRPSSASSFNLMQRYKSSLFPSPSVRRFNIDVDISVYTPSSSSSPYVATPPHSAPLYTVPLKAAPVGSSYASSTAVDTTPLPALQVLGRGRVESLLRRLGPHSSKRRESREGLRNGSGFPSPQSARYRRRSNERKVRAFRHSLAARILIHEDVAVSKHVSLTGGVGEDVEYMAEERTNEGWKEEGGRGRRLSCLLLPHLPHRTSHVYHPLFSSRLHLLRRHARPSVPPSLLCTDVCLSSRAARSSSLFWYAASPTFVVSILVGRRGTGIEEEEEEGVAR